MFNRKKIVIKELTEMLNYGHVISAVCGYFRHDFGLLSDAERKALEFEARQWILSIIKTYEDRR